MMKLTPTTNCLVVEYDGVQYYTDNAFDIFNLNSALRKKGYNIEYKNIIQYIELLLTICRLDEMREEALRLIS